MQWIKQIVCFLLVLGGCACSRQPDVLVEKGLEELQEGKSRRAFRTLRAAAEKIGEGSEAALVWNAAGVAASGDENEEEAEEAFLNALEIDPVLAIAHVNLGHLYREQGRNDEALASFSEALKAGPEQTEILEILAVHAIRTGDREEALGLLNQASRLEETARTLSSLAVLSADTMTVDQRRALLQRAVTMEPRYAPAQLNLAALLDQHRLDPEQALAHYEFFARLDPESPLLPQAVQRAQVMESRIQTGEIRRPDPVREEVESLLQQAAALEDPRQALPLCLRAHAIASRASRQDLRERALRAATTLAPDSARAHVGLARFLKEQGRDEEAFSAFVRAHAAAPQWGPAFQGAVTAAVDLGKSEMAGDLLAKTLTMIQDQPASLLEAAELYAGPLQEKRKARGLYRDIRENFPGSEAAETATRRLND